MHAHFYETSSPLLSLPFLYLFILEVLKMSNALTIINRPFTNYTIRTARLELKNHKKMIKIYCNDARFASHVHGWCISIAYLNRIIADLLVFKDAKKRALASL